MITEDYVSFEVAKLLKEKGFDEPCFALYNPEGVLIPCGIRLNNTQVERVPGSYSAPTLQMAMKWLREVHKLHITVYSCSQESWMYRITEPHKKLEDGIYAEDFTSYEEACEAAIKYVLEHLI